VISFIDEMLFEKFFRLLESFFTHRNGFRLGDWVRNLSAIINIGYRQYRQNTHKDKGPALIDERLGLSGLLNPLHDLTPCFEVYPEIPKIKTESTLDLSGCYVKE